MANRARARSTSAAGALSERLRRVSSWRSSAVSGRRGSVWWRDMGHLGARGSPRHDTRSHGNRPTSTTAGVDEFWFYGSSVIVWRAAGVVVASPTKRGCDRDRAALPRRYARGAGAPREP